MHEVLESLSRIAGDIIVSALGLLLGIVLYALIFRPGLLVRKR